MRERKRDTGWFFDLNIVIPNSELPGKYYCVHIVIKLAYNLIIIPQLRKMNDVKIKYQVMILHR